MTTTTAKYCDICGHLRVECTCQKAEAVGVEYIVNNLDCAHCAAKIEEAINALPEVKEAQLTFATKVLKVKAYEDANLLQAIQQICDKLEEGVVVSSRTEKQASAQDSSAKKQEGSFTEERKELGEIIIGGAIFVASEWLGLIPEAYHVWFLLAAYLLLGREIVILAGKNILKGNALDENFLMAVATMGAFAIKSYEEAVGVMLFYRIGELFEHKAVEKSRAQIMSVAALRPEVVNLVAGDSIRELPADKAQVGDIILVRVGERIPLDGVVVEGSSQLDTSALTGEPVPLQRTVGEDVLSGCINALSMLKIKVTKPLAESMVTKIVNSVENAAASKPKIDRFITRFAKIYTPLVVVAAALVALGQGIIYGQWYQGIYTALTFLVISCPCALVLSVPLAFFAGIGAGSKQGILFKGGIAIEALKNIKAVVMDKTGTITQGNFIVQEVVPVKGVTKEELLLLCASAEQASTHPIAKSIVVKAKGEQGNLLQPLSFTERAGEGLVAEFSSGRVMCGNEKLLKNLGVEFTPPVLSEAYTKVLVAKDNKYIGAIFIGDTLKADAKAAIHELNVNGIATAMLTGDSASSANAVAQQVGIRQVHAQLLPQDKLKVLQQVRQEKGAVLFVGDGINDAPVLAGADVGAAMGTGADAAIEAADVVFLNSRLASIPMALRLAKITNKVSWENVYFALGVKFAILVAGVFGYASMWAAVFADTGVAALCVLNSVRVLYKKI